MFRSIALRFLLAVWLVASAGELFAAVTTVGAVPNATPPAGGGAVVGAFTIGEGAFGSVTVTAGTAISNTGNATLGNLADGIGVVSLSGFGSNWSVSTSGSDFIIGDEGVGLLSVTNQSIVSVPDDTFLGTTASGQGKISVSGLGSVYDNNDDMTVGVSGIGIVDILDGGSVSADVLILGELFNGQALNGQGRVKVSDEFSRLRSSLAIVGRASTGRVEVLDRAQFICSGPITIGDLLGSVGVVEVSGVGSSITATALSIGVTGTGSLNILNGGRVICSGSVSLGNFTGSVGAINIEGAGSRLSVGTFSGSNLGESSITIGNGAVLATNAPATVPAATRVILAGGRWEPSSTSASMTIFGSVEGGGTIDMQTVTISGASTLGRLATNPGDRLLLTGTLSNLGLVDLAGGELQVAGTLTNSRNIDVRGGTTLRVGGSGLLNQFGSRLAITNDSVDVFGNVTNNSGAEIAVVGNSTGIFHDAVTNSGTIFVSASSEIALLENLSFVPSSGLSVELASIVPQGIPTDAFGLTSVGGSARSPGR